MIFRQYLHSEPIAASYFFGCGGQSTGAIVDPLLEDVDFYIEESKRLGMEISYIFDTHLHADHLSGGRLLAEKTGAKYVLHESAQTSFDYYSVKDNDQIILGNVVVDIMHTPGHTPEHITVVVTDKTRGVEPWFVLTGHTLMVGDVGRTELASDVEEGASQLYDSIFNKLVTLDDHIEVYPGAFSGSVCGRTLSGKPSSSIGFEKKFNHALQKKEREEFISFMVKDIPPKPDNFEKMRKTNMGVV